MTKEDVVRNRCFPIVRAASGVLHRPKATHSRTTSLGRTCANPDLNQNCSLCDFSLTPNSRIFRHNVRSNFSSSFKRRCNKA